MRINQIARCHITEFHEILLRTSLISPREYNYARNIIFPV